MKNGLNNSEYMALSSDNIIMWINAAPGDFSVRMMSSNSEYHFVYTEKLEKLVEIGYLERVGKVRGWYRRIDSQCEPIDFINSNDTPVDLWLPLCISDYVQIYAGNIIIIAGAPNSGKTAFMLNIAKENMRKDWETHYFTSEMGPGELKLRLGKFPYIAIDQWNIKAYQRGGDFQDVIKPGTNKLNIIDFLEVHDEFYMIAKRLKEIHDKLKGGIAVIGLQKNPGLDTGLGGYRSMEVTRLALALDKGECKIVKAKNWVNPERNPNGSTTKFKLVDGCQIIQDRNGWQRPE